VNSHADPASECRRARAKAELFKGDTGEPLLPGDAAPAMVGLHHFQTLIATRDRLYVGADGRIYAFAF
jgi:hypothetical protein